MANNRRSRPEVGETVIAKMRTDAFVGTPLNYLLRLYEI